MRTILICLAVIAVLDRIEAGDWRLPDPLGRAVAESGAAPPGAPSLDAGPALRAMQHLRRPGAEAVVVMPDLPLDLATGAPDEPPDYIQGAPLDFAEAAFLAAPVHADLRVTAEFLHLRAGPAGTYDVLATLRRGHMVQPIGPPRGAWTPVWYRETGAKGWVFTRYLRARGA